MGDGSYVGILREITDYSIEISQLDYNGKPYAGFEPEQLDWNWSSAKAAAKAQKLGLEVGDRVEVHVEFERYTAFKVEPFDWNPRRLHERLLQIEKHLGLEP
jgi:hypothetical protein